MWQAMIFVQEQYIPLHWEKLAQQTDARDYPISRLCIMIRDPESRHELLKQAVERRKPTEGAYSEWQSRQAWELYGTLLRRVATILAPRAENVFLFYEDIDLERLEAPIARLNRWVFSWGKYPRLLRLCEQISMQEFVTCSWPQVSRFGDGTALLFEPGGYSPYQQQLIDFLRSEHYHEVKRLMEEVRFDPDLLTSLVASGTVYIHVGGLAKMPESMDPWYFVPQESFSDHVLELVVSELISSGLIVFVSHCLSEYYLWQELGELPKDAVLAK
jgi:hypothetical protein